MAHRRQYPPPRVWDGAETSQDDVTQDLGEVFRGLGERSAYATPETNFQDEVLKTDKEKVYFFIHTLNRNLWPLHESQVPVIKSKQIQAYTAVAKRILNEPNEFQALCKSIKRAKTCDEVTDILKHCEIITFAEDLERPGRRLLADIILKITKMTEELATFEDEPEVNKRYSQIPQIRKQIAERKAKAAKDEKKDEKKREKDVKKRKTEISIKRNSVLNAKPRSKGWSSLVGAFRKASSKGESSKTRKASTLKISRPYLQSSSNAFVTGNEDSSFVHHEQSDTTYDNHDDTRDFLEDTTILGAPVPHPWEPQRRGGYGSPLAGPAWNANSMATSSTNNMISQDWRFTPNGERVLQPSAANLNDQQTIPPIVNSGRTAMPTISNHTSSRLVPNYNSTVHRVLGPSQSQDSQEREKGQGRNERTESPASSRDLQPPERIHSISDTSSALQPFYLERVLTKIESNPTGKDHAEALTGEEQDTSNTLLGDGTQTPDTAISPIDEERSPVPMNDDEMSQTIDDNKMSELETREEETSIIDEGIPKQIDEEEVSQVEGHEEELSKPTPEHHSQFSEIQVEQESPQEELNAVLKEKVGAVRDAGDLTEHKLPADDKEKVQPMEQEPKPKPQVNPQALSFHYQALQILEGELVLEPGDAGLPYFVTNQLHLSTFLDLRERYPNMTITQYDFQMALERNLTKNPKSKQSSSEASNDSSAKPTQRKKNMQRAAAGNMSREDSDRSIKATPKKKQTKTHAEALKTNTFMVRDNQTVTLENAQNGSPARSPHGIAARRVAPSALTAPALPITSRSHTHGAVGRTRDPGDPHGIAARRVAPSPLVAPALSTTSPSHTHGAVGRTRDPGNQLQAFPFPSVPSQPTARGLHQAASHGAMSSSRDRPSTRRVISPALLNHPLIPAPLNIGRAQPSRIPHGPALNAATSVPALRHGPFPGHGQPQPELPSMNGGTSNGRTGGDEPRDRRLNLRDFDHVPSPSSSEAGINRDWLERQQAKWAAHAEGRQEEEEQTHRQQGGTASGANMSPSRIPGPGTPQIPRSHRPTTPGLSRPTTPGFSRPTTPGLSRPEAVEGPARSEFPQDVRRQMIPSQYTDATGRISTADTFTNNRHRLLSSRGNLHMDMDEAAEADAELRRLLRNGPPSSIPRRREERN